MASTLGKYNPFRYRGYVYDEETGLYYLNSRYYDPKVGRFISKDDTTILEANTGNLSSKNLFEYCDSNPVIYKDTCGYAIETVFDLVSLGFSIAEVIANPYDPMAWLGLAGDAIDLVPFVTGVGETVKGLRFVDKAGNVLEIAKATDFTNEGKKLVKQTQRIEDQKKSNKALGRQIHKEYKATADFDQAYKEYRYNAHNRFDYYDDDAGAIYELKPYNKKSAKLSVRQLKRYNEQLGGKKTMRLEFY